MRRAGAPAASRAADEARTWLTENLTDPAAGRTCGDYHRVIAAYVARLPDDDPELARVTVLLVSYGRGPGGRPSISVNGDDEDTADVIAELLDDDETALESGDGIGCHGGTALSRENPGAFLRDLVDSASTWLAQEAGAGIFSGD
jgi:hypothetical protein